MMWRRAATFLNSKSCHCRIERGMKPKLKPGDTVRVVGERGTAKIRALLTSMHGALLETQIGGFRRWNLDELRLVKRAKS